MLWVLDGIPDSPAATRVEPLVCSLYTFTNNPAWIHATKPREATPLLASRSDGGRMSVFIRSVELGDMPGDARGMLTQYFFNLPPAFGGQGIPAPDQLIEDRIGRGIGIRARLRRILRRAL